MTEEQFKEKVTQLLTEKPGIHKTILDAAIGTMASRMAKERFLKAADDDFVLPKLVLATVLAELVWHYEPVNKADKSKMKFIKPLVRFS